jgi:hypothetical protein
VRFSSVVSVGSESQLGLPFLRQVGLHHSTWTVTISGVRHRRRKVAGSNRTNKIDGDVEGRGRLKVRPFITRTTCDYY